MFLAGQLKRGRFDSQRCIGQTDGELLQMGHLLVGLDTRLKVAYIDTRDGVDSRHICDDSHDAILGQMVQTDIQMCRQIEMAHIEESALGLVGILTGLTIVGNIT